MKQAKTIVKATNATAVDFGKLAELSDYVLELSPEVKYLARCLVVLL